MNNGSDNATSTAGVPVLNSAPCPDRRWCTVKDAVEHADFHAGDTTHLAHYERHHDGLETGWWGWAVEDRNGGRPALALEGLLGEQYFDIQVDMAHVAMILAATETPAGREALEELVRRVA